MIDFLGVAFGFFILLASSAVAGLVVAAVVAILFWSRWRRAIPLCIGAIVLAPLCVVWFYATVAFLPGESLFGDINERLPNGYHLSALGKMPDFATIDPISTYGLGLPEGIASLQVQGNLVVGQYSHPLDTFTPKPVENYFLFDTRTGEHREFPNSSALQAQVSEPLRLVPAPEFRSPDPASRRQRGFNRAVTFGPMIVGWTMYLLVAAWLRLTVVRRVR